MREYEVCVYNMYGQLHIQYVHREAYQFASRDYNYKVGNNDDH